METNSVNPRILAFIEHPMHQQQGAHSFHVTLEPDTAIDHTLCHIADLKFREELEEFTFYYQP